MGDRTGVAVGMLCLLLIALGSARWAGAQPVPSPAPSQQPPVAELVAPSLDGFLGGLRAAEGWVEDGEAQLVTLARVQNHWATDSGLAWGCGGEADHWARIAHLLGTAAREALQSARAEVDRLEQKAASDTLAPLLREAHRERLAALQASLGRTTALYHTAFDWQTRLMQPRTRRCTASLLPHDGLPAPVPLSEPLRVAVVALPGWLCTADRELYVEAPAVVVVGGAACWQPDECDCAPQPILAAQVLGP